MANLSPDLSQTQRIPPSSFSIEKATPEDLPTIVHTHHVFPRPANPSQVQGLYTSFPPSYWDRKEPLTLRPSEAVRHTRMIARILPTFSEPSCHWLLAKHVPTGEIAACAWWIAPGSPIHNFSRKDAGEFYGWRDHSPELWAHVDDEAWSGYFKKADAKRKQVLGEQKHWYLASLFTVPAWQGKGAGKLLVRWGVEQADLEEPGTPCYLESSEAGRRLYEGFGFVAVGRGDGYLRRGGSV